MANSTKLSRVKCVTGNRTLNQVKAGSYILPPFGGAYIITGGWLRCLGGAAEGATSININDDTAAGHVVGVAIAVAALTENTIAPFDAATNTTRTTFGAAFKAGRGLLIEDAGASALTTCTSVDFCVEYQTVSG